MKASFFVNFSTDIDGKIRIKNGFMTEDKLDAPYCFLVIEEYLNKTKERFLKSQVIAGSMRSSDSK